MLDDAILDVVSSDPNVATVTKNEEGKWVVIAGEKAGTATITASIHEDPLKRKATCKVKVIAMQAVELKLFADATETDTVILDAENVSEHFYEFTVSAQNLTYQNQWEDTANVTWASGNTAIATVKANADGTATVTVKKGASGECAITATAKDLNKISANLWLSVRDYQPRLESNKPTLNTALKDGVTLELLESYGNAINELRLYENGAKEPSERFTVTPGEGTITIQTLEAVRAGTYKLRLEADCENSQTYSYDLQLKVTSTLPTVTLKQNTKFNLFYWDSVAEINVSAKNAVLENVVLESDTFTGSYLDGVLTLRYSDDYVPGNKVNAKATVEVWLEGYQSPVTKTITISTVTTAPKLKLSSASSIINTALSEDCSTAFRILYSSTGEVLDLTGATVESGNTFATVDTLDNDVILSLNGTTGGTATFLVKDSNWTKSVKLTHKITVQTALPTLKLGATTLKLNKVFPDLGTETTVTLSQGNLMLNDVEITPKTAGAENVLDVTFEDGKIVAKILNEQIKAGNYLYTCTGKVLNEETFEEIPLKPVTLKVTVSSTSPKVKLSSTTFKLNRILAGEESISTKVTVPAGYRLDGFDGIENTPLDYADGYLTARLTGEEDTGDTYTIYPMLIPDGSDVPITMTSGLKVKVTTYTAKVTATVTTKGKLDVLNPNSAITCTVKLKNCTGSISGVSLSGQDGELFRAETNESGNVILTLNKGEDYATNKTYKVSLDMLVCGKTVSKTISFKVTQSALKLTATPSSMTCYQAIGYCATTLKLTSPATAEIADVTLSTKTATAFQKALGTEENMKYQSATGRITFALAHPGLLTPGKSYTVYLDVTPKNAATNVKPTQIKLTVKVQK